MKVLYFAWLKTKTGVSEETLSPPDQVKTVADLLVWLKQRGPGFEEALADIDALRVAVNQEYAEMTDPVSAGDEVALFPPVTGG